MNVSSSTTSYQLMQLNQVEKKSYSSTKSIVSETLENSDSSYNSTVSAAEFNISSELFSSMDSNSDGTLDSSELEETIASKLDSLNNQSLTSETFSDFLSELGLEVSSDEKSSEGSAMPMAGGGGGSSDSEEEYDPADINQDGTVTTAEQEIYDGQTAVESSNTLDLVSTLINALKSEREENNTEDKTNLGQFKQVMSMVNEEFQDSKTKESLDKYLNNLAS